MSAGPRTSYSSQQGKGQLLVLSQPGEKRLRYLRVSLSVFQYGKRKTLVPCAAWTCPFTYLFITVS